MLPLVSKADDPVTSPIVVGRLDGLPLGTRSWAAAMRQDPALGPRVLNLCLHPGDDDPVRPARVMIVGLTGLATLFGWLAWLSHALRRLRANRDGR
jgi:hypothetical protein